MGIWRSLPPNSNPASEANIPERKKARRGRKRIRAAARRELLLERFEDRLLLAGPQLISIIPNAGDILQEGQTRHVAPRELTFRFDQNQDINPISLGGIQIVRGGVDHLLGTGDDVRVVPGFAGIGKRPSEVVLRFSETLPDDVYRITLVGTGANPLRNLLNEPFNNGRDDTFDFRLDLGAKVVAVVPQPVSRDAFGNLSQAANQIDVYFNNDDLRTIAAGQLDPAFFQLLYTNNTATPNDDPAAIIPTSVSYDPATDKAVLTFSQDLSGFATGAFRLRIGNDDAPLPAPDPIVSALDPGSTFSDGSSLPLNLGTLTTQSQVISQSIDVIPTLAGIVFPGGSNEIGHREIPVDNADHLEQPPGGGVPKLFYNFQDVYGFDLNNVALQNVITDVQKQRTREIFELISQNAGVQFIESADDGFTIATGDPRAVDPTVPSGVTGIPGIAGNSNGVGPTAVVNAGFNWGDSEYGGNWFRVAFHEILHLLGLGHSYELPSLTIQANEGELPIGPGEPVFPGDHDIAHLQHLYRREGNDIDMYTFVLDRSGTFSAETIAERLSNSSHLDTLLTLYNEVTTLRVPAAGGPALNDGQTFTISDGSLTRTFEFNSAGGVTVGNIPVPFVRTGVNASLPRDISKSMADAINSAGLNVRAEFTLDRVQLQGPITVNSAGTPSLFRSIDRQVVSRNEDYYSRDSFTQVDLLPGRYYLAVTSTGNSDFDPNLRNSGFAGRTTGGYDLRVDFSPAPNLTDAQHNQLDTNQTALDGDDDGLAGGEHNFWFNVGPTLWVDKLAAPGGDGSLTAPFSRIEDALIFAGNRIIVPLTGADAISDGDTFLINDGINSAVTFEFDLDGALSNTNHVAVPYLASDNSAAALGAKMVAAINSVGTFFATQNVFSPEFIDLSGKQDIDLRGTPALAGAAKIVRIVGNAGPDVSLGVRANPGLSDGATFRLAVGGVFETFEFNQTGGVAAGNVAINFTPSSTAAQIATAIAQAINSSALGTIGGGNLTAVVAAGTTRVDLASVDTITLDVSGAPSLIAVSNAVSYEIGRDIFNSPLADGYHPEVPQGVTVMIDAGAIFKLRGANLDVGSNAQNIDHSRGALQVLGIPGQSVFFTSYDDEGIGQDTNPLDTTPARGDWGGLVFRDDSDREAQGIFLNSVNHADIRYGGGQVEVNSVLSVFNPIHMVTARPTISHNSITDSADAAISADPNSFEDTRFENNVAGTAFTSDYDRVGPHIHDNRLVALRNMFNTGPVITTPAASDLQDGQTL